MSKYGYNVLKVDNQSFNRLLSHCAKLPPGCILFYNSQGDLAWKFKAAFPDWIVIHRSWPDHVEWQQTTPSEWYRRHFNRGNNGVIIHTQNEVGVLDAYFDWSTELTKIARPDITRFVHLNFAVGHGDLETWKRPAARRFLEEIAKDGKRHYVGLHEYWPSEPNVFTRGTDQQNPAIIDRSKWHKSLADALPGWLCARYPFLYQACDEMQIPRPPILLTEVGTAEIGAVDAWQKALPKTPPYTNLDGWKANREVWRKWWPDWTHEQAYAEQMLYALRVLWSGVEGVVVFGWGDSGGWEAFDVAYAIDFQARMEAGLKQTTPAPTPAPPAPVPVPTPTEVPFPTTGFEPVIITPLYATINMRSQPKIAQNILLILDSKVRAEIAPLGAFLDASYKWYPIRIGSMHGWLRNDVFTFMADVPPEHNTITLTDSEIAALKSIAGKLP